MVLTTNQEAGPVPANKRVKIVFTYTRFSIVATAVCTHELNRYFL